MPADTLENLRPVAFICSSGESIESLVSKSKRLSKGDEFILLTDESELVIDRLGAAYINSILRRDDSSMRASSQSLEMLLLLSGTMKIDRAISGSGARSGKSFVAFATSRALFGKFSKACGDLRVGKELEVRLDPDEAPGVSMTELLSEK